MPIFRLCLGLVLIVLTLHKQILIDYTPTTQTPQLHSYFHNMHNQFYIDLNPNNTPSSSNTLSLYLNNWNGIKLDARPSQIKQYSMLRPDVMTINMQIGIQKEVVKVVDQFDGRNVQIDGNCISLGDLCDRFYYGRPQFMDIGERGEHILQGNDWGNEKCIPEVIMAQGKQAEKVLSKYGYSNLNVSSKSNIYVHAQFTQKYKQQLLQSQPYISSLYPHSLPSILQSLSTHLSLSKPTPQSTLFPKLAKHRQTIQLINLHEQIQTINFNLQYKYETIVVFNYHAVNNMLVLSQGVYEAQWVNVGEFRYYKVEVVKFNRDKFVVYVLEMGDLNAGFSSIGVSTLYKPNVDQQDTDDDELFNTSTQTTNQKNNTNSSQSKDNTTIAANQQLIPQLEQILTKLTHLQSQPSSDPNQHPQLQKIIDELRQTIKKIQKQKHGNSDNASTSQNHNIINMQGTIIYIFILGFVVGIGFCCGMCYMANSYKHKQNRKTKIKKYEQAMSSQVDVAKQMQMKSFDN